MTTNPPPVTLADIRREIDRIDEAMHRLLMERGEVIETLIEIKKTQASGSAFRPGREADQMKRLAERHQGLLPFDTVESIWRVIVSTFTYVQAPYTVHADSSLGDDLMRDTARFHFGFTVPYRTYHSPREVIDAVATSAGDLGIFPANPDQASGSWWIELTGPQKPKIIGRPESQWGELFATLAQNVADAPPVRPKPMSQEALLGLFSADTVGRDVVLEPATIADMMGRDEVVKPSLEVIYDEV